MYCGSTRTREPSADAFSCAPSGMVVDVAVNDPVAKSRTTSGVLTDLELAEYCESSAVPSDRNSTSKKASATMLVV